MNRNQLQQLNKAELIDLIESLFARINQLDRQVAQQVTTIKKLEDQLAKNSLNSSKPPSSDGVKKPRTRSLRKKTGKKQGGQKGHPGKTLLWNNQPDERKYHSLEKCPNCRGDLSTVPSSETSV